ncbi:MAG: InlB B-repeat-containing protein [Bacillota bacterium]
MRKLFTVIAFLLLSFSIAACTGAESITISFETNGGNEIEDMVVETTDSSFELPTPVKEGYSFDGWFVDEELTNPFAFAFLLSSTSLTVYAKWISGITEYTITFNTNEGTAVAAMTAASGATITAPTQPTKTGFTFGGWYSDVALTTAYTFTTMPASNMTLYAKWNAVVIQTTISFEVNGGSAVAPITQNAGSAVVAPTNPTKTGYVFAGWYSDVALTTAYTFTTMPESNITLYAKWTINQYVISFEENGGSLVTDITQVYLSVVTAPAAPAKSGYVFAGWYSDAGLTTAYTFTTMPLNGITLYAKWTINQYTISFEENGGSAVTDITQNYMTSVIAPTAPTKSGYTFGGWYSDVGLTTAYTFTTMPAANITIYAKWDPILYTITFFDYINGYDTVPAQQYAAGAVITVPVPTDVLGYDFIGWFSDIQFINPYVGTIMPDYDFTLYGQWVLSVYTVTYETNGGTVFDDAYVPYTMQIPNPGIPTKEGFVFAGWYADEALLLAYDFLDMPAEDMTVYAKWVADDGYDHINLMLINQPADPVTLRGVIYYKFPDPMNPGFYLYDGTGFIFVLHTIDGFNVGDGVEITASFDMFENTPQLIDVTSMNPDGTFITMPESIDMDFDYLIGIPETDLNIYGKLVKLTGVVGQMGDAFYLTVLGTDNIIVINYKSYLPLSNPFVTLVGQTVTIQAIIHDFNSYTYRWHVLYDPLEGIVETPMTDQEKLDELVLFAQTMLDGEVFYNGQSFMIPAYEPVYGATLVAETFGDNAAYYDPSTGEFTFTPVSIEIGLRITATIGALSEVVEVTIILMPVETLTIAEFMLIDEMEYCEIIGVVIFTATDNDMQMMIIADETGMLVVISIGEVVVGDLVRVAGYKMYQDGIAMLGDQDPEMTLIEIISHDQPFPINPIALTVEQFIDLDANSTLYWLKYFEVSGRLIWNQEMHMFFLEDGLYSMPVLAFNDDAMDLLFGYEGLVVTLRGISLPSFDEEGQSLILAITGHPEEIILDYTDEELVAEFVLMLTEMLEGPTYYPGQFIELPTEHPVIPLTVAYELFGDNAGLLDLLTGEISPTIDSELWIDLHVTLSYGSASQLFDIQLHVAPIIVLSVTEFYLLPDYDNPYFVEGIVIFIQIEQPVMMGESSVTMSMVMIADAHSVIMIMTGETVEVGDHIIAYGYKMNQDGMVILVGDSQETLFDIVSQGNPNPMVKTIISVSDFLLLDMTLPENALKYYQLTGTLVENEEFHVFFVQDGEFNAPIFPVSQEGYMSLLQYKDMEVLISGLSISNGEGGIMLIYINYPGDVIPNMTPEEFADYFADTTQSRHLIEIFRPGTTYILKDDFPLFNLTITYETTGDNAASYDVETGWISDTITTDIYIDVTATSYIDGILHATYAFQIHVVPEPILTVSEFFYLTDYDNEYLVLGTVIFVQSEDNLIMIADDTRIIMVMSDGTVEVGDQIKARGFKMEAEGMIILVGDSSETLVGIVSSDNPMPLIPQTISFADFNALDAYDPANSMVYYEFVGVLHEDSYSHMLYLSDGLDQILIYVPRYEDYEDLQLYVGLEVRLRAISTSAGDSGMLVLAFINYPGDIDLAYTAEEYVDLLATRLPDEYDDLYFIPGQTYLFPTEDPNYDVTFSYELLGPNASLYDLVTGFISDTIVSGEDIEVTVTIVGGVNLQIVVVVLHVIPPVVVSIADFIIGTPGILYQIQGIVMMSMPEDHDGASIVADATGQLFILDQLPIYVGEEVIIVGYQNEFEGIIIMGSDGKTQLVDVLSSGNVLPVESTPMTIAEFNLLDMTDMSNWGQYVEITGYMSGDWGYDYFNLYLNETFYGGENLQIEGTSNIDLETMADYFGLEVVIKGFILPYTVDEFTPPYAMFFFADYTDSLTLTYITDLEKIDALIQIGTYHLEGQSYLPGDNIMLPDEFPILGITLTWAIVAGPAEIYDFATGMIYDVISQQTLIFEATITVGTTTATHQFTIVIDPLPVLTIEDFCMLWPGESAKVQGVVIVIIDTERAIILDETGMIIVTGYTGLNVGDEILIYGKRQEYNGAILLGGDDGGFYDVLDTGITPTIPNIPMSIQELATYDYSYFALETQYVTLQGRLTYSEEDLLFYISNGVHLVYIIANDLDAHTMLSGYLNTDVTIKAYTYEQEYFYYDTTWSVFFAGEAGEIAPYVPTDEEIVSLMIVLVDDAFDMMFHPNSTYMLHMYHPIYGGTLTYTIFGINSSYASILGDMMSIYDPAVSILVDIEVTATFGTAEETFCIQIGIQVGDNPMSIVSGSLGNVPESLDVTIIEDLFGGLYIEEVSRENDFFGGTEMVVDLWFPAPDTVGAEYYILMYYDDITGWEYFNYDIYTPLTTTGDNFSLVLDQAYQFRLYAYGVPGGDIVSNIVEVPYTVIESTFVGWSLDMSMWITGTMYPYVGCGMIADAAVTDLDGVVLDTPLNYQWYRVNPYTYETILISGATHEQYMTTLDDAGYLIMVRISGDEINVGGFTQIFSFDTIKVFNPGFITNVSESGFVLNLGYQVTIEDIQDYIFVYDQDGIELPVILVSSTINPAIYNIQVDLTGVTEIYVDITAGTWSLGSFDMYEYSMPGITVYFK